MSDTEEDEDVDVLAMIADAEQHEEELELAEAAEAERNVRPRLHSPSAPPAASVYASPQREEVDDAPTQDATFAPEQQRAFDLALGGSNLFLTGGPGTGKSFTLRKIIDGLEEMNGSGSVLVWAPTGVAAILVGGQTINSKPGPGIPDGSSGFENMWAHKKYWREVKTLVIDEISMVDAEFLDWIEAYVREMCSNDDRVDDRANHRANKAFGGMQLIFCGDFCQLPPICKSNASLKQPEVLTHWQRVSQTQAGEDRPRSVLPVGTKELNGKWCFQTACW